MKLKIEWQDNFSRWHTFQTKFNERDAYKTAKTRAKQTGKRHRLVDEKGSLLDLIEP